MKLAAIVVASAVSCASQKPPAPPPADPHRTLTVLALGETQWQAGPESAVRVAHVYSDPSRPGLFVQRMQMPPGTKTPPHWHAEDELITVISGSIYMGSGEFFDEENAKEVGPGGLVVIPARSHHFGGTRQGAVLQVQGIGPFEMNWLR
jgi:quercetin dioxygenase-like cupin family protein